jgi:F0F1-type ATP synthase assembly protein I
MSVGQDGNRPKRRAEQIAQAYRAAHEVVSAAASIGVMAFIGYWLDEKFDFSPVLLLCGSSLGFVMAGLSLRQLMRRLDRELVQNKRRSAGKGLNPRD